MEIKILLAYASTHGSTLEAAEAVAATLRDHGLVVDLLPARNVRSLEGYSAVVLGAPIYMFHLHKDALRFLSRHQETLTAGIPVAIFAGGPIKTGDEKELQEVQKQLDSEMAKFPWLQPVSVELIGGRLDPTKLRFPWNLIPAVRQMPPSDLRDWAAIRAWANNTAAKFQSALNQ